MFRLFQKKKLSRKEKSEKFLEKKGVKINYHLPRIESEEETRVRSPREIAERVSVLSIINLVAFNSAPPDKTIEFLKDREMWHLVTPDEKEFLKNPGDEEKINQTWKCECIWTLLWALKIIDRLGYPNEMCDLSSLESHEYPIGANMSPSVFMQVMQDCRSKKEILDTADLYYRMDWACVDARLKGEEVENLNSSVVYERHYALNWLINYMDSEWDDVSCDT